MNFVTSHLCEQGGRAINQDAWDAQSSPSGTHCWVLADGLGGHGGGEVAARVAVEEAIRAFERTSEFSPKTLRNCIDAAQAAILAQQKGTEALAAMRSTLVLLLADNRAALFAHVGDSRLYHLRTGRIIRQTADHSVPQALVAAGDLRPEGIRHHEDRNRLLRALGEPGDPRPTIESRPCPLLPGDAFLLCTDGFWEYVHETEIEADFAKADDPDSWLVLMHERLRARADSGNDNYTAVAVFVEKE
jgi:serine/threonine protein phosphatase PrpC